MLNCVEIVRRASGEGPLFVGRTQLARGALPCPGSSAVSPDIAWAWNASAAPENVCEWHTNCDPILHYIRELEGAGVGRAEIEHLDAQVCQEADDAAHFALESPLPEPQAALHYAFAGQGH
jgi:hypothetical protein